MKKRKIMMSAMSATLVAAVAVGGTLAYLSDKSNTVSNTFNIGNGYEGVGLWLDEKEWVDGVATANRTEIGNDYGVMYPGSIVEKDPTFHLTEGSTESYVFAYVSGVDAMVEVGYYFTVSQPEKLTDPTASAFSGSWTKVDGTDGFDGLYIYNKNGDNTVNGGQEMDAMFNWVKLGSDLGNEEYAAVSPSSVDVRGVAVQTANLTASEAQVEAEELLATMPLG